MKKQDIILAELDNDPVFENNTMIAARAEKLKNNILRGSYVIIPKSQVITPFELSKEEWMDTFYLLQEIKEYIDGKYKPDGYNIGWNVGKVGGQSVAHAHLHILPRYKDEPLAGKGIRFMFKQECGKDEK